MLGANATSAECGFYAVLPLAREGTIKRRGADGLPHRNSAGSNHTSGGERRKQVQAASSSACWPRFVAPGAHLSAAEADNGDYYNWNKVLVKHCAGGPPAIPAELSAHPIRTQVR
jgi:hypothetical protein